MDVNTVRIDLHCHSTCSDGNLNSAQIARRCAEREVRFAALTDHNALDGLDAFESCCERHGLGFISGLELNVLLGYKEIHLLCYGFDRTDIVFLRTLAAHKSARAGTGSAYAGVPQLTAGELIKAVHAAGGLALLAHPLKTEPGPEKLARMVAELFSLGLDGIEVYYSEASSADKEYLRELVTKYDGVVSAGTDHHGLSDSTEPPLGIDMPVSEWRNFRERLIRQRKTAQTESVDGGAAGQAADRPGGRMRILLPMVLPALAMIALFTLTLFGFFLPRFEAALLERKRETIMELTRTVWSMLEEAEKNVQARILSLNEAQAQVAERIRALRYGRDGKDYFWLQDLEPKMIMHPWRQDLEGRNLADFRDPRGGDIFVVFADKVRRDGSGYVDYVWQWKDDPERIEAKESYIRLFEPWGWVIGTGMYIDDVKAEIIALEMHIYHVMLAITAALIILLMYMLRGGLKSEQMRLSAERRLHESNARYASLVHAAAEGVLFVRNQRCVYANPVFLELAGCDAEDLPLLDWNELFPRAEAGDPASVVKKETEIYTGTLLHRRDGSVLECRMAIKGMPEQDTGSFVILVRRAEDSGISEFPADSSLLKRLLKLPSTAADDIARKISLAEQPEEIIKWCGRTPELARAMLESGASPVAVARMLSSITDSATGQFIAIAQAELGEEPVAFAFVAVGSQGRQEQTLFTDQDNVIIYDAPADENDPRIKNYFMALADRVCNLLAQSGYRICKGQLMANNTKWCQPLDSWRGIFSRWIRKAEGHEAMDFMTLFDLRCVFGRETLVRRLRMHIYEEVTEAPWFFMQAAQNAIHFKTPLRIFGNIVTAGRAAEKTGHLDIKAAMMPIVCYARLYALKHKLYCTATAERLSDLNDQGIILPSRYHDLLTAFETLMRLRLRHQVEAIQAGGMPDNLIKVSWLGHIDEAVLKECFSEIDRIQQGISREFLGGASGNQ